MTNSFTLRSMCQVTVITIVAYNLYTSGIFYLGISRLITFFGDIKKSFFYTLNVSIDAWNFEESLFQCLKRNISIKLICLSGNSSKILKNTVADNLCINHNFNEFFYIFINITFCALVITGHILNSKIYPPLILFLYAEYKFSVIRSIRVSFDFNTLKQIKRKTRKRKEKAFSATPKQIPLSRKLSFRPVNTIEQSENDDILSSECLTQQNISNKLTYPTKTNVKDLERYAPKIDKGLKKGIFFDMTSKEGLSLWEKYLKKLGSKADSINPEIENYKIKECKLDIDMELKKMNESGELQKYLSMNYRRIFITELKIWVTKNRLNRAIQ